VSRRLSPILLASVALIGIVSVLAGVLDSGSSQPRPVTEWVIGGPTATSTTTTTTSATTGFGRTSTSLPPALPPPGRAFLGVTTQSAGYDLQEAEAFAEAAGRAPNLLLLSVGWAGDDFDARLLDRIWEAGMVPLIGWEPWDHRRESPVEALRGEQPEYRLSRILAGEFDSYVRDWAEELAAWGRPVLLRLAHEMNGTWYPWSEQVNGNSPGEYVAAWHHVRSIFEAAGARNVRWVWSPNIVYYSSAPLAPLYPGDDAVDLVGVVGYYGHGRAPGNTWRDFAEIYDSTIAEIRTFTRKPILLTEVAATEVGGFKARWITQFFEELRRRPDIVGFVWYERVKETDWRIMSSDEARSAFAAGAADPRFDWRPWPAAP
jgi:mannan endo-1,4-beta-mannosidase